MMASKSLVLLFIMWRQWDGCSALTVDPPVDVKILDPGHLGYLEITWSPPASLINMTECSILYQLEYWEADRDSWTAIRTIRRSYSAQFNLMRDVKVRVYTLLNGPCAGGTLLKSGSHAELVQKPPSTGLVGTKVKDLVCVFHNMESMMCHWKTSKKSPPDSQQNLYFWHKELGQTEECPQYQVSSGVRSGCNFTGKPLPNFTDINFCVNGSSPEGPLKPTYVTLQIQNLVKPAAADKLHLQAGDDAQLELQWKKPAGRIPGRCLEWEVEHSQEDVRGKNAVKVIATKLMSVTVHGLRGNKRSCFRVRSRLHNYCAERSFWSDWSQQICHPAGYNFQRNTVINVEFKNSILWIPRWKALMSPSKSRTRGQVGRGIIGEPCEDESSPWSTLPVLV